jgi:hypothetical protein
VNFLFGAVFLFFLWMIVAEMRKRQRPVIHYHAPRKIFPSLFRRDSTPIYHSHTFDLGQYGPGEEVSFYSDDEEHAFDLWETTDEEMGEELFADAVADMSLDDETKEWLTRR